MNLLKFNNWDQIVEDIKFKKKYILGICVGMQLLGSNSEEGKENGLKWVLLTSETINSFKDAREIVKYYEVRWKIEEYHKAWKSGGTQVEKLSDLVK